MSEACTSAAQNLGGGVHEGESPSRAKRGSSEASRIVFSLKNSIYRLNVLDRAALEPQTYLVTPSVIQECLKNCPGLERDCPGLGPCGPGFGYATALKSIPLGEILSFCKCHFNWNKLPSGT